MYCPKCGVRNPEHASPCRGCGLGLRRIERAVADEAHSPAVEPLESAQEPAGRGGRPILWAALTVLSGLFVSVIARGVLVDNVLVGVGLLTTAAGLVFGVASFRGAIMPALRPGRRAVCEAVERAERGEPVGAGSAGVRAPEDLTPSKR